MEAQFPGRRVHWHSSQVNLGVKGVEGSLELVLRDAEELDEILSNVVDGRMIRRRPSALLGCYAPPEPRR